MALGVSFLVCFQSLDKIAPGVVFFSLVARQNLPRCFFLSFWLPDGKKNALGVFFSCVFGRKIEPPLVFFVFSSFWSLDKIALFFLFW